MAGIVTPPLRVRTSVHEFSCILWQANFGSAWQSHRRTKCFRHTRSPRSRAGYPLCNEQAFLCTFNAATRAQSKNVLRIDGPESDKQIALDDVRYSLWELPDVARSLVEGAGYRVLDMILQGEVDQYVKCSIV